jgi:hypothetical protein
MEAVVGQETGSKRLKKYGAPKKGAENTAKRG